MRYFLIILMAGLIFSSPAMSQDSSKIKIGKDYKFSVIMIPFGATAQASSDKNTQLDVKPFIGSGLSYLLTKGDIVGVGLNTMIYANDEKIMFPLIGAGVVLFPMNDNSRVAISLAWDFGKIAGEMEQSWKERLKVMFNYNIDLWKK